MTEFEKELASMLEYAKEYAKPGVDVVGIFADRLKKLACIDAINKIDTESMINNIKNEYMLSSFGAIGWYKMGIDDMIKEITKE